MERPGKSVFLLAREVRLREVMSQALKGSPYRAFSAERLDEGLERLFLEPPDLLVLDESTLASSREELVTWLSAERFHGHVPILLIVHGGRLKRVGRLRKPVVDDFLVTPFTREEFLLKVHLCFQRGERQVESNPLTLLPGNLSIIKEMQRRLDRNDIFAFGQADLDDFKPYNDRYGFSRGDEILRMTARHLTNTVFELAGDRGFVGHVGGDDFVFFMPPDFVDEACNQIIHKFDKVLPNFYDEEDRTKGYIVSLDRRGNENRFPLMTISIGVTSNETRSFTHYGEMIEVANDLKNYAKKWPGSRYSKDKRAT